MDEKTYRYRLSGNADGLGAVAEAAADIDGVESASLEDGVLALVLSEHASEYDVFCALTDIAEGHGVDVDDEVAAKESEQSKNAELPAEDKQATETKPEQTQNAPKLKLPDEEQPWMKKHLAEYIELGLSFILLLVGVIFNFSANTKTALLLVSFIVVGYEIIWEAAAAIWRKQFLHYSVALVPVLIASLFVTSYAAAASIALMFQALIVLGKTLGDIDLQKLKDRFFYDYIPVTKDGDDEQLFAKDVGVGAVVAFKAGDIIPFDGEITEGSAKADAYNCTGIHAAETLAVGSTVIAGSRIVEGDIKLKVNKTTDETFAAKMYKTLKNIGKKDELYRRVKKLTKRAIPICFALTLILCFAMPALFIGEGHTYLDLMTTWSAYGVMFFAISNCFVLASEVLIGWRSAANRALSAGAFINSEKDFAALAAAKKAIFNEPGGLTASGLEVDKVIAVPAYKGKLLRILSDFGLTPASLLNEDKVAENEKGDVLISGSYDKLTDMGIDVKKLHVGEVKYIALNGEVIGAISFAGKMKDNSYGGVMELRSMGIKSVVLSSGNGDVLSGLTGKSEIYENLSDEAKNNVIADEKVRGVPCAYIGVKGYGSAATSRILFGSARELFDDKCGAIIPGGDVKTAVKIIRLSRRAKLAAKAGIISSLIVKAAALILGSILVFTGSPLIWIPILIDVLGGASAFLLSQYIGFDI